MLHRNWFLPGVLLAAFLLAACSGGGAGATEPRTMAATMAPLALPVNLDAVDLCQAIPQVAVEAALGAPLAGAPQRFAYGDATGSSGCQYDAGADSQGNARFAYVAILPVVAYDQQPQDAPASGIGSAAFFTNGADARQIWVKFGEKAAVVVAIGDVPNEDGLKALAQLIAGAIQE